MEPKKKFTPTNEQTAAAETVMLAMALVGTIEPTVSAYKRRILSQGQWRVCPTKTPHQVMPEIVSEPRLSYLLSEQDFAEYDLLCQQAAVAAGLHVRRVGNCPLLEAESDLIEAKHALARAMDGTSPVSLDRVVMLAPKQFGGYVELLLKLLAPFVRDAKDVLDGILNGPGAKGIAA